MLASGADFNQVEEHESDSEDSVSHSDIDVDSEALIIIRGQVKMWARFN